MTKNCRHFLLLAAPTVLICLALVPGAVAQTAPEPSGPAGQAEAQSTGMLHFIKAGGVVGYFIILLSFVGGGLVIDAFLHVKQGREKEQVEGHSRQEQEHGTADQVPPRRLALRHLGTSACARLARHSSGRTSEARVPPTAPLDGLLSHRSGAAPVDPSRALILAPLRRRGQLVRWPSAAGSPGQDDRRRDASVWMTPRPPTRPNENAHRTAKGVIQWSCLIQARASVQSA